jgi:hypothetical protein
VRTPRLISKSRRSLNFTRRLTPKRPTSHSDRRGERTSWRSRTHATPSSSPPRRRPSVSPRSSRPRPRPSRRPRRRRPRAGQGRGRARRGEEARREGRGDGQPVRAPRRAPRQARHGVHRQARQDGDDEEASPRAGRHHVRRRLGPSVLAEVEEALGRQARRQAQRQGRRQGRAERRRWRHRGRRAAGDDLFDREVVARAGVGVGSGGGDEPTAPSVQSRQSVIGGLARPKAPAKAA